MLQFRQRIQNLKEKSSKFIFSIHYIWAICLIIPDIILTSIAINHVSAYNYLSVVPMITAIFQGAYLFTFVIWSSCEPGDYYGSLKKIAFYLNVVALIEFITLATLNNNDNNIGLLEIILLSGLKTFFTICYSIERCVNIDQYGFIIQTENERYLPSSNSNQSINYNTNSSQNLLREVIIIKADESNECAICFEECKSDSIDENRIVCMQNCKHVYHDKCIKEWIKINKTCPQCRK